VKSLPGAQSAERASRVHMIEIRTSRVREHAASPRVFSAGLFRQSAAVSAQSVAWAEEKFPNQAAIHRRFGTRVVVRIQMQLFPTAGCSSPHLLISAFQPQNRQ
jgi:hypothetical protein